MTRLGKVTVMVGGLLMAVAVTTAPSPMAAAAMDPCVSVQQPFDNDGRISGVEDVPVWVSHPDLRPVSAELFVDGTPVGVDDTPWSVTEGSCGIMYLFEVPWDTTQWQDGPHQVNARALMPDGSRHWSSNTITLDVDNH